mgnify:CR=1 FL=1
MKSKTGAMEMSVGTIVTIVLLMSVLILGIFLTQKIFTSAKGAIDLTDAQLKSEINKLFSDEKEVVIYPQTRLVEIKQEEIDEVGIGIQNLLQGSAGTSAFSYEVVVGDVGKCGVEESAIEDWIVIGKSEENIPIASGDDSVQRVRLEIPKGSPLCTARFRVNVNTESGTYATDFFDINVKAK